MSLRKYLSITGNKIDRFSENMDAPSYLFGATAIGFLHSLEESDPVMSLIWLVSFVIGTWGVYTKSDFKEETGGEGDTSD